MLIALSRIEDQQTPGLINQVHTICRGYRSFSAIDPGLVLYWILVHPTYVSQLPVTYHFTPKSTTDANLTHQSCTLEHIFFTHHDTHTNRLQISIDIFNLLLSEITFLPLSTEITSTRHHGERKHPSTAQQL